MPNNKKVIKREDLESVIKAYKKYHQELDNGGEGDDEWKQWKDACVKAFPTDKRSYREFETLKSVSRVIGHKDFETIVKVYQALGYEII